MKAFGVLFFLVFFLACCAPVGSGSRGPNVAPSGGSKGPLELLEPSCRFRGVKASFDSVHSERHLLMVTVYDIENGEDKTYQLETIPSTHTHSVLVRAEDFTQLSEGKQIELWSSDAHGHRHQIILSCI